MKSFKEWRLSRQIDQAAELLAKIDRTMKALRMPQWKRKQMWRDFYKSEEARKNVIKILIGAK